MQISKISVSNQQNNRQNLKQSKVQNSPLQQNVTFTSDDKKVNYKKEAAARLLALALATGAIANPYSAKASSVENEPIIVEVNTNQQNDNNLINAQALVSDVDLTSDTEVKTADSNLPDLSDDIVIDDISIEDDLAWHEQGGSAFPFEDYQNPYENLTTEEWEQLREETVDKHAFNNLKHALSKAGIEMDDDGNINANVYIMAPYLPESVKGIVEAHNAKLEAQSQKIDDELDAKTEELIQAEKLLWFTEENLFNIETAQYNVDEATKTIRFADEIINRDTKLRNKDIKAKNNTVGKLNTAKNKRDIINQKLQSDDVTKEEKADLRADKVNVKTRIENLKAKRDALKQQIGAWSEEIKSEKALKKDAISTLKINKPIADKQEEYSTLKDETEAKIQTLNQEIEMLTSRQQDPYGIIEINPEDFNYYDFEQFLF